MKKSSIRVVTSASALVLFLLASPLSFGAGVHNSIRVVVDCSHESSSGVKDSRVRVLQRVRSGELMASSANSESNAELIDIAHLDKDGLYTFTWKNAQLSVNSGSTPWNGAGTLKQNLSESQVITTSGFKCEVDRLALSKKIQAQSPLVQKTQRSAASR